MEGASIPTFDSGSNPKPQAIPVVEEQVIPVVEEQLQVGKKVVETGSVRIIKKVQEEQTLVEAPLIHDEVNVERVAVNQYIETAPQVRYEGDIMIIPVIQEVVVIEKRLMLVEEIRVHKQQFQTNVSETVTLRKEVVSVERTSPDDTQTNAV
jgi:uncharacterized protein (TIGR02271 family)